MKSKALAVETAKLLTEHKAKEVNALYIGDISSFTDCFVIGTFTSQGHLKGLVRHLKEYLARNHLSPVHKHRKIESENWVLIDCGRIVIHLLNEESRTFYELEKLWHSGETIYSEERVHSPSRSS
ncbi:MAG: ribosome silencing factor [Spirochaetales bacterium]|nr:ribosome silencing factor [Spirochaetales bacterium]MCF7937993.1 ribosome silencing factor [Spirochaetales bacterium]